MLTLLHAADLHLDSPFRSLPPQEAAQRRREQREALGALRDLALERRADLLLLSGDLFDGQTTYPETIALLARTLGELPIPVCIAPGNHDFFSPKSPYATVAWPENVHIFTTEAVTAYPLPGLGLTVYGAAFTAPSRESDPLAGFTAPRDGTVSLGVFHGDVGGRGGYGPISPDSLAKSGLAYAALGHIHAQSGLQAAGATRWAYPGCLQGRGFDEPGDKGAALITLEGDRVTLEQIPLPGPRYCLLTAPLTGEDPAVRLLDLLGDRYRRDYLRLTLTGESAGLDLPALRRLLSPLCRTLELRDETTVSRDLWARAAENNLTGLFLREMRERLAQCGDDDSRRRTERATRFGLAALEGREMPI